MAEHEKEIDTVTGRATTGHEWDGLKELNTPLPKWWLYTFYVSIIGSIVYYFFFPAWPIPTPDGWRATAGSLGYSQRATVTQELKDEAAKRADAINAIASQSFEQIEKNPNLLEVAQAGGRIAFKENCAPCHGTGAQGGKGFPNLNDDDWLWGGKVEDIHATLLHGIRWDQDADTRVSAMPAFGKDGVLSTAQIEDVTDYVLSLSRQKHNMAGAQRGAAIFAEQCVACHGETGKGNREFGAPNLTDAIWLYGKQRADIVYTIANARNGRMPAWKTRLDPVTIKQLAIYIHTLGGGEPTNAQAAEAAGIPETQGKL
ncbi:MAG: cytochrome-c oxidase, cbb3-type subunit III [Sphingomonadales bacterium]|nr:MAG: cytochrome-c oxidase, cbb3-type subunit III [Sphingomonadales bacterium]